MADFPKLFMNFMFIALIVFSVFAFGIGMQIDNNVNNEINETDAIGNAFNELGGDIRRFKENSSDLKKSFETDNAFTGIGGLIFKSVISGGTTFASMVLGLFNTLIKLPVLVLGLDPRVLSILISMLVFVIVFGLWRIYKAGG